MLKTVIVDDEPKAIQGLSWELTSFNDEIEIVKTFSIPEAALEIIEPTVALAEKKVTNSILLQLISLLVRHKANQGKLPWQNKT
jgi:DNA-binding LytR/AlgR family response regulator